VLPEIKTDLFFRYTAGKRPRLVFIHGVLDRSQTFRKTLNYLKDYETVIYDRRGYGRSINAGLSYGLEQHFVDLKAFIPKYETVLVGHSYGALLALYSATKLKNIIGVVAYEPPLSYKPWWFAQQSAGSALDQFNDPEKAAEAFLIRILGKQRWETLSSRIKAERKKEGPAFVADLKPVRQLKAEPFNPRSINAYCGLVQGELSFERNKRASTELHALIKHSDIYEIKGAAHFGHQSHPKAFAEIILSSIKKAQDLLDVTED
jgi:pimeloyl-ACP methyl ester carboxylesterase